MLTIQPGIHSFKPAFKSDYSRESYDAERKEWEDGINELEELKSDQKSKVVNKIIKGGVVVGSAGLGFLAGSFGIGKVIEMMSKAAISKPVKALKNAAKSFKDFAVNSFKSLKKTFKDSDIYKKPAAYLSEQKAKFLSGNFGKKANAIYTSIKENKYVGFVVEGLKSIYKSVKNGIKFAYNKVKGVKKETASEVVTNIFGAASGIASGVAAATQTNKREAV